jgi:glutaconyl-CoA/methylmalonyl-CoA decarboxylase subunit gamma
MKKLAITVNGKKYDVEVEVVQDDEVIESQPKFHPPARSVSPVAATPTASSYTKPKVSVGSNKTLTSPINGVVLEIPVAAGQKVKENEILFIVEAMKMKTNISSPQKGKIVAINAKVGDTIETGQILLTFE